MIDCVTEYVTSDIFSCMLYQISCLKFRPDFRSRSSFLMNAKKECGVSSWFKHQAALVPLKDLLTEEVPDHLNGCYKVKPHTRASKRNGNFAYICDSLFDKT